MEFLVPLAKPAGLIGVAIFIGAYAALQTGLIRGQSYTYSGLNALAASFVLFSMIEDFNLSSAVIQVFWISFSVIGIARLFWLRHRLSFNEEELDFVARKFPGAPLTAVRRLFDNGRWVSGEAGDRLTTEGEPVSHLIYLSNGRAAVLLDGHRVGTCEEKSYIGEVTCMNGDPATATVELDAPSRYFCIEVGKLRQVFKKDMELRHFLQTSFASEVGGKLKSANEEKRRSATVRPA